MAEPIAAVPLREVSSRLRPLEVVAARVRPEFVRILRAFEIPPEDARDLVQNVYLAFLEKSPGIAQPFNWLLGALRRECLHYRRSERRKLYRAIDDGLLDLAGSSESATPERKSLLAALGRRIAELDARCRELLALRYRLGCDRLETATQLGVRPASIGTLERRCLAALSERLLAAGRARGPS